MTSVAVALAALVFLTACHRPSHDLWEVTWRTCDQPAARVYRTCHPDSHLGPFEMFLGPDRITHQCGQQGPMKLADGRTRTTSNCVIRAEGRTSATISMDERTSDGSFIHNRTAYSGEQPRLPGEEPSCWTDITEERIGVCPPGQP